MKQFRLFAAFVLLLGANLMSAQTKKAAADWPKLSTVIEVADRIDTNVKNNNQNAFYFAETLDQHAQALLNSDVPQAYATADIKEKLTSLAQKTAALNVKAKGKADFASLKTEFKAVQDALTALVKSRK